eukprot:82058_1
MAPIKNTIDNILLSGYLREHEDAHINIQIPKLVKSIMSVYCKEYTIQSFGDNQPSNETHLSNTKDIMSALNDSNEYIFKANTINRCFLKKSLLPIRLSKSIQEYMDNIMINTKDEIIDIQKSEQHTLILTSNGIVYAYGLNDNGQCGLGKHISYIEQPTKISFECKIKSIACGTLHSLFINNQGKLLVCGFNYCGQLGIQNSDIYNTEQDIDDTYNTEEDDSDSESEDDSDFFEEQCQPIYTPIYNEYFDDLNITFNHISCGAFHSLVLTTNGECYTFGHNGFGNLGNGSASEWGEGINIPYKLDIDRHFMSVSCGKNHSILLTDRNEIIVFGDNNSNQCSKNINENQIETPYILSKKKK